MTNGGKSSVISKTTILPEQQEQQILNNENNNNILETTTTNNRTTEEEKEEENNMIKKEENEINNNEEEEELNHIENSQQNQKSPQKQKINNLRPDEYNDGLWDAEPFYYCSKGPTTARGYYNNIISCDEQSNTEKRQKRGLIYKKRENITGGAANEYECFQSHEGIVYRQGDHVFVESCREDPFLVGSIVSFKMKKRDQLLVKLLRYYRPNDVPELSFSLVTQARIEEGQYHQSAAAPHSFHCRELFSSETTLLFHVAALRGKCSVHLVKDLRTAFSEIDLTNESAFFHCLNYNQESGRLASVQMSIKVGAAYQANIPSCSSSTLSDDPDRDELLYRPGYLCAETEEKYLKMARTFRTFSLLNNKKITMLEKAARTGDLLLDDAVVTLHRSGYSVLNAINTMQAIDNHLTTDSSFMNADDVKKFGKGIKQYGKNFNKINRDLLGNHRKEQLIAFYYLWKKSANATRPKPLGNAKRSQVSVASVGRRGKITTAINGNGIVNGKTISNTAEETPPPLTDSSEPVDAISKSSNSGSENSVSPLDELQDYASASETETEQLVQQPGGVGRACHHCFTSKSIDWHHCFSSNSGHDRLLLMCTECRIFYKRYGQLRPVDRPSTVPPCLILTANNTTISRQYSEEEDENEEPLGGNGRSNRLRTRGGRNLSQRTPSSLDLMESGGERLGSTLQKVEDERRNTPLRNSAGKTSRKRGINRGGDPLYDESTPTPPKGKKSKKGTTSNTSPTSSLPSNNSRTPSPPTINVAIKEDDNQIEENSSNNTNNNSRKRISKKGKEKLIKERSNSKEKVEDICDGDEATCNNTVNVKKVKLERADSHAGVVTPQPAIENTNELLSSSNIVEKSQQINEEDVVNEDLNSQKQSENQQQQQILELAKQQSIASPKNSPLIGAATIISRKPVAKVEPLETNKEENKNDNNSIENQQTQQQETSQQQTPTKDRGEEEPCSTTIICVDFSSDEEGENNNNNKDDDITATEKELEQDCGPLGEADSTEIYRTSEGKKDFEGKLISIEYRTILERRLKRVSGLTCARTDIAFLESPERAKHNQLRRERERYKKEQERAAKLQQQQMQQQKQLANTNISNNNVPIVQPLKKMEMPAEFSGQQLSSQQLTPSLIYLPNGQCATIPCASIAGNGQQQHSLHNQFFMNGSLLPGNTNGNNIPGGNPLFSQFNSFNQTIQQQQSSDASSALSINSTLATTSMTAPQQQTSFQHQQNPLVAIGAGNSHPLAVNQQTLIPSAATQLVNQTPALLHQQQQQQENALLMQMLMGDPRLMQQLQAIFHMQQQQQHSQQTFVPPSTSITAPTATTNTASAPIPTPNIVAQQNQQQLLQMQQMQILLGLQQHEQKQQFEQLQRQQQQKNSQQRAGSVASTSNNNNIVTPQQQHLLNGFHNNQNNPQQHKLSGAGFVGQGNNNNNNTPQHFSQTFAQQKSKKEASIATKNQQQQQHLNHQQQQAAMVRQLFCGSQPQNVMQQHSTAVATMFALQQQQQRLAANASNNNNNNTHFQQQQQCSNNNLQQQQTSLLAAEMEAINSVFQQQQNSATNVQQQQLQEMLTLLTNAGNGLSQQEQRLIEEQIKIIMQNQQQKQIAAQQAVHAQQQQQQQNAQHYQTQQQQQLMAALAAASAATGNNGADQMIAAQQIAQQIALQQQQQQNQQQPSSSNNPSSASFFQQQQFQNQLMQAMAMHQMQQQHQNQNNGNQQQQQISLDQQHLLQQQLEMFRRQSSQNNISNSASSQQRNVAQEQSGR